MEASDFAPLVDWLNANPDWIFATLAFIAFLESLALAGVIIPGVLLLFVVAIVAGGGPLTLEMALLAGFIGAVLGDGISFLLGYFFKDSLPGKWPFKNYPKMMKVGEDYFLKHGGKSVVIGRFVGPLRPVLPLIAGMFGMSPQRFFTFNILSAIAWSPFYILPGFLTGAATQLSLPPELYVSAIGLGVSLIISILLFRWMSLRLQIDQAWYDAAAVRRANSTIANRFWQRYVDSNKLTGEFPLASLFLTLFALISFWLLGIIVSFTDWFSALDQYVSNTMMAISHPTVVGVASAFTLLGDRGFLYISFTAVVLLLLTKRNYVAVLHVIAAGLLMDLVTHQLKWLFEVPRPEFVSIPPASFAFPSGHTSGATLFFGLIAGFVAQTQAPNKRWLIYAGFAVPIFLIALSRIVLNVHWVSDILGGLALGLFMCGATRLSYSFFEKQSLFLDKKAHNLVFVGLWLICVIAYVSLQLGSTIQNFSP